MSPHPKCPVCHHSHRLGADHIYDEPAHGEIVNASDLKSDALGLESASLSVPTNTTDKIADIAQPVEQEFSKLQAGSSTLPVRSKPPWEDIERQSIPGATFDRNAYQRAYMRHRSQAKAEGLSVIDYWKKHSIDWRQG